MKKFCSLLMFVLCISVAFGQDYQKIDSLKHILGTLPELDGSDSDTIRMQFVIDIAKLYQNNPDSSLFWLTTITDNLNDKESILQYKKKAMLSAEALYNMGIINYLKHDYFQTTKNLLSSLHIYEELNEPSMVSKCLVYLGISGYMQGNLSDAVAYLERSLKIYDEIGDLAGGAMCLSNLSIFAIAQGNYADANLFSNRSLKIAEELNDKATISSNLLSLGSILYLQGNYSSAVSSIERSLSINEELGNQTGISSALHNLGNIASLQGNYPKAISFFERSLLIAEKTDKKRDVSFSIYSLGNIAVEQGSYVEAGAYYERALKISEEIGDIASVANILSSFGALSAIQGRINEAAAFYERALSINEQLGSKYNVSICLTSMGIIASMQHNYTEAVSLLERSLGTMEEIGDKTHLAKYYPVLANAYIKTGQIALAPQLLHKSLALTIWLLKDNFGIMSEKDKEMYLEQTKGVFNEINAFNINYPGYNDSLPGICYNNELILKGLLLKSTAGIMDVVYNSPDPEMKKTYFLLKQYRDQISSLLGSEQANRDSLIADLDKKANEQERKLVRMSSEFADIQNLFEYKWQDVQKNLKQGEAAIEFVSFTQDSKKDTSVYAALIITPESKMPHAVKLFNNFELQNIINKSVGTGYGYISSLYSTNSTALYNLIWKPLESELAGINKVYFAPSGVLNNISFSALSKDSGVLLCDYIELVQLSTTGKLINKQDVQTKQNLSDALVFGGIDYNTDVSEQEVWTYLPGTLAELQSIEKIFKKGKLKYSSFSGKEAKEDVFKQLFANNTSSPCILHISTHGFFYPEPELAKKEEKVEEGNIQFRGSSGFGNWMFLNNKNPMMRSGLVFAGANRVWSEDWGRTDNEGVLTAYEISNMLMKNTQLVVLSACETGLGDIKGSEGVYGLQRSFKMAGVKYLIMSLWEVPDAETVEFMTCFYEKLLKNKNIRQSFTETQQLMRNKYDPFYWAAFVLVE